jgi:hypothetical protein
MLATTVRDIHPLEEEMHYSKPLQDFHFILVKISTCSPLQSGISILLRKKFIPQNLFKFMTVLQDKVTNENIPYLKNRKQQASLQNLNLCTITRFLRTSLPCH